jgi:hypothetical protein
MDTVRRLWLQGLALLIILMLAWSVIPSAKAANHSPGGGGSTVTMDDLIADGYDCGLAGDGGYACTKRGASTYLCDLQGQNCQSILVAPTVGLPRIDTGAGNAPNAP